LCFVQLVNRDKVVGRLCAFSSASYYYTQCYSVRPAMLLSATAWHLILHGAACSTQCTGAGVTPDTTWILRHAAHNTTGARHAAHNTTPGLRRAAQYYAGTTAYGAQCTVLRRTNAMLHGATMQLILRCYGSLTPGTAQITACGACYAWCYGVRRTSTTYVDAAYGAQCYARCYGMRRTGTTHGAQYGARAARVLPACGLCYARCYGVRYLIRSVTACVHCLRIR
jgi:hypothetical protein